MGGFPLLSVRRFGPRVLEADVNGGVDDGGVRDVGAGEEHEFGFVINPVGLDFGLVGHRVGSIDQFWKFCKIFLKEFGIEPEARHYNNLRADAKAPEPDGNDFKIRATGGEV